MALYRNINLSFWTDSKVDDEFTPEDKYFFLYLLTNPHTNICGCYEISIKQMCRETGYNDDTILRLLQRMENTHMVIRYSKTNKEVLILNWWKYNWTNPNVKKGVCASAQSIKTKAFKKYVLDTLGIGYPNPMQTSDTDCYYSSDVTEEEKEDKGSGEKRKKEDVFSDFASDDEALLKALKDFEKMRKGIGKPLTERAKQMLLNKLQTFPETDWVAIIEQSIFHCWQGIFDLKDRRTGPPVTNNVFLSVLESGDYE